MSMKEQCEVGEPRADGRNGRGRMEDSESVTVESADSLEVRETEKRRNNVVIYRAPEVNSNQAEDRKCGDVAFVQELCNKV